MEGGRGREGEGWVEGEGGRDGGMEGGRDREGEEERGRERDEWREGGGGGHTPASLVPKTKPSGVCSSAQFVHCVSGWASGFRLFRIGLQGSGCLGLGFRVQAVQGWASGFRLFSVQGWALGFRLVGVQGWALGFHARPPSSCTVAAVSV